MYLRIQAGVLQKSARSMGWNYPLPHIYPLTGSVTPFDASRAAELSRFDTPDRAPIFGLGRLPPRFAC